MSKKIKKIILVAIIMLTIFNIPLYSNATTLDDIIEHADRFLEITPER